MVKRRVLAALAAMMIVFGLISGGTVAAKTDAPDLVVTAIDWSGDGQVKVGTVLHFSVTVKNQGTAAVSVPFTVDIGYGTEKLFTLTHTAGLAVGAEVTLTSPAYTAQSGDRMVTARVNSTGTVTESEEWDNDTLQRNLRIGNDRYEPAYAEVLNDVTNAGMFDLTFNEDFNDVTAFDTEAKGKEGYKWYIRRHSAFPNLKPTEYRTQNGILTMDCSVDTFAIGAATIDRVTGIGYTFNHGYLEFRLRMPVVGGDDESKTAIWSFPRERYAYTEDFVTHVEMDWLEYYGNNHYTVMLHEQSEEPGRWDWYSSKNGNFNGLGDQKWHVMGYLWEEGKLRCYLDGKLFHTQTWGPDEMPIPVHDVRKGEIKFDGVFSHADTQDMLLFIFGSSKIPLELDYVRIWQYGGDAPKAEVTTTTAAPTQTTTVSAKPNTTQSTLSQTKPTSAKTTTTTETVITTQVNATTTITSTATSTQPAANKKGNPAVVVGIVAGAVVLLGGGTGLVVWLKKRPKQ